MFQTLITDLRLDRYLHELFIVKRRGRVGYTKELSDVIRGLYVSVAGNFRRIGCVGKYVSVTKKNQLRNNYHASI